MSLNGAGKTTTIEILEGLGEGDSGEVRVLGLDWRRDAREIRARIGAQLQETKFPDKITVLEVLRLFRSFYRDGRDPEEVVEMVQLGEKARTQTVKLSGGQRQRLALGCALVNHPELLFLDEPTTGLDPQARRHVWEIVETIKAEGGTVLLTTHYMEEAGCLGVDEPGDDADVALVGRLLLLQEPPRGDSPAVPGATADRAERRAARDHAGGDVDPRAVAAARDRDGVGSALLRTGGEAVPLERRDSRPSRSCRRVWAPR